MLDSEWITTTHVLARRALKDDEAREELFAGLTPKHVEALCAVAGGTTRPAAVLTPLRRSLLEAMRDMGPSRSYVLRDALDLNPNSVPTTLERMRLAGWVTRDGYFWSVTEEGLGVLGG